MASQGFKVILHKKAGKYLNKIPSKQKEKIEEALIIISHNPYSHVNIKKMNGFYNTYRYRYGDYRIIYAVEEDRLIIFVLTIGTRGDIYK